MTPPSHGGGPRFESGRAHMNEDYFVRIEEPEKVKQYMDVLSSLLRRARSITEELGDIKDKKKAIKDLVKEEVKKMEAALNQVEKMLSKEEKPKVKKPKAKARPKEAKPEVKPVEVKPVEVKAKEEKPPEVMTKPEEVKEIEEKRDELRESIKSLRGELEKLKKELEG